LALRRAAKFRSKSCANRARFSRGFRVEKPTNSEAGADGLLHQKRMDAERERVVDVAEKRREVALARHSNGTKAGAKAPAKDAPKDPPLQVQTGCKTGGIAGAQHPDPDSEPDKKGSASLRSAGDAGAPPPAAEEKQLDAKDLLWRDGLPILRKLTSKGDDPTRRMLGKMVDAIGKDHAALLAILRRAASEQPDGPVAWIHAAINSHCGLLAPVAGPRDPWGINAWAMRQTDAEPRENERTGRTEPAINGHLVFASAEMIAEAISLPETWRGNWDAMGAWMRDDLVFADPRPLRAMADQTQRMGVEIRAASLCPIGPAHEAAGQGQRDQATAS
jgi:hypothetical protein